MNPPCKILYVSFISLSLQWIETTNIKWVYRSGTAAREVFNGSHFGQPVGTQVMSVLKQLGIYQTVVCVTSDTAATTKNAIEHHTAGHIA